MDGTTPSERIQQFLPQVLKRDRILGDRYLLFQVIPELTVAISLDLVWEVTILPAKAITPIPQMPPYILGWTSGRDKVYSVIAFAEFLELMTVTKIAQDYPTIVLQLPSDDKNNSLETKTLLLGIAVERILRTTIINPEEIISPREDSFSELTAYLQGYWQQESQQIFILNFHTIRHKLKQLTSGKTQ